MFRSGAVETIPLVNTPVLSDAGSAKGFSGKYHDFGAFFDCPHDMGDPAGVARYVKSAMKPDGTWMIVEPFTEDATEANHNPIGRV